MFYLYYEDLNIVAVSSFVYIQAVLSSEVFHTHSTFIGSVVMVNFKMLLHIPYVCCYFVAEMTLHTTALVVLNFG